MSTPASSPLEQARATLMALDPAIAGANYAGEAGAAYAARVKAAVTKMFAYLPAPPVVTGAAIGVNELQMGLAREEARHALPPMASEDMGAIAHFMRELRSEYTRSQPMTQDTPPSERAVALGQVRDSMDFVIGELEKMGKFPINADDRQVLQGFRGGPGKWTVGG